MPEILEAALAAGFGFFFLIVLLLSLVEFIGKIYGTYTVLIRRELTSEQRVIYLLLVWFVPFGWLIYFLLGRERTSELFAEVEFL
ncbi:MAG: hypothetical protein ABEJ98_01625 [Candidatus Nanohaloarchaea archaeon]